MLKGSNWSKRPRQNKFFTENQILAMNGRLKAKHIDVLLAARDVNLTYEEIAAKLGLSVGTVKSRLNRAREVMNKFLAKKREAA